MPKNLKALRFTSLDPALNLALEECLLCSLHEDNSPARGSEGLFLLWRNGPSVIVGRHQNTVEEVNGRFLREQGIGAFRRTTGGGAVYHDEGNLNFSFLLKTDASRPCPGFADILRPVAAALADLGVAAELSNRNDITVGSRKISGSAMRRTASAILAHGTVLVDLRMDRLGAALAGNPDKYASKGIGSHRSRVTNLREFLPPEWAMERCLEELSQTLIRHCAAAPAVVGEADLAAARELADRRYRSWEWNYGASPPFTEKKRRRFSFGAVEARLEIREGVIASCRFYGDFFAERDMRELEDALLGVCHNRESLRNALAPLDLSVWFSGCDPEEVRAFLLEGVPVLSSYSKE